MTRIIGRGRYARAVYPTRSFPAEATGVLQGIFTQAVDPGENQDFTTASHVDLLDGSGTATPMLAQLPNPVQPDSVFRVSVGIAQILPTVLGGGNVAEISIRGSMTNPDDANFPNNTNPFGFDLGHIAGSVAFVSTAFGYEGYLSQAQIAAVKVDGQPTFGRPRFGLKVALQNGIGADTVRITLFNSPLGQRVWLGIEEIAGGTLVIE